LTGGAQRGDVDGVEGERPKSGERDCGCRDVEALRLSRRPGDPRAGRVADAILARAQNGVPGELQRGRSNLRRRNSRRDRRGSNYRWRRLRGDGETRIRKRRNRQQSSRFERLDPTTHEQTSLCISTMRAIGESVKRKTDTAESRAHEKSLPRLTGDNLGWDCRRT